MTGANARPMKAVLKNIIITTIRGPMMSRIPPKYVSDGFAAHDHVENAVDEDVVPDLEACQVVVKTISPDQKDPAKSIHPHVYSEKNWSVVPKALKSSLFSH